MKKFVKIFAFAAVLALMAVSISACTPKKEYVTATIYVPDDAQSYIYKVEKGEKVPLPVKEGYIFVAMDEKRHEVDLTKGIEKSVFLLGKWVTEHEVKFDINGASSDPIAKQIVRSDKAAAKPAQPTRDGYKFKGWFSVSGNGSFLNEYHFTEPIGSYDITLKAKWAKLYTVSIDSDGGSAVDPVKVEENTQLKLNKVPTKEGKFLVGFVKPDGTAFDMYSLITADITLKAVWGDYKISGSTLQGVTGTIIGSGTKLTIPEKVGDTVITALGPDLLKGQSAVTSLELSKNVTFIDVGFWANAGTLTSITVAEGNTKFTADDKALYNNGKTSLYWIFNGELTSFEIPASVTKLSIDNFVYLTKLTSITVGADNAVYSARGGLLYSNKGGTLEVIPAAYTGVVTLDKDTTFINPKALLIGKSFEKFAVAADNKIFVEIDHLIYRFVVYSETSTYYTLAAANRDFAGVATILKGIDLTKATFSGLSGYALAHSKLTGIRYTDEKLVTAMGIEAFDNTTTGFKVYVPKDKTAYFTGMLNTKWDDELKAFVAKILVEE